MLVILVAAVWLTTFASFASSSWTIWPFPSKKFTGNTLINAGSMGLDVDRVIAFGDFNGDQFLDILALDSDQKTMSVYLWNHEAFTFQKSFSFSHSDPVQNVVPGDFTHSGKLDLLVMGQHNQNQLDMWLYPAKPEGGFDSEHPISVPPSSLAQPIPLDLNGDLRIDLLGSPPSGDKLQVWYNIWDQEKPSSPLFNVTTPSFPSQCTLPNPHSNAVVDLDGDCLADFFLICTKQNGQKYFQIWINKKASGFVLSLSQDLPDGMGPISFADVNRDGTIDLVFATCESVSSSTGIGKNCAINVAFNKQLPLCSSSRDFSGKCRRPDDLCIADPNFKFDFVKDRDNDAFLSVPISDIFPGSSDSLLMLDTSSTPPAPIPLKLGDADLDGFPDLLVITAPADASKTGGTPKLLFNVACNAGFDKDRGPIAGCVGQAKRGWRALVKDVENMDSVKDARSVSFLDIDEDGTMDIMIQRINPIPTGGKIQFIANNFYYDAFFLKAIVLNGACDNGWCYAPNSTIKYRPLGVSYSGASYKYTVLDTVSHRSAAQIAQLPLTSYQSLLTPYSFFGLGRTNNYIENLFVGSTIYVSSSTPDDDGHYINLEGVIPNSKVVIFPPPMPARSDDASPGDAVLDPGRWRRELFLRPGEWIPWVTITVLACTVILAAIVFVLHLNEKREDELERRRASHHINFDAL